MNRDLCALNARAAAPLFWPEVGFYDRAASRLATLLNVDGAVRFNPHQERSYLCANRWLDAQCLAFFARHPKAMAIELGAGLSTRFHRLSESHEWPQFSWVDIDTPDITELKAAAMPAIDNYRLFSSAGCPAALAGACGWRGEGALLIIVDSVSREQLPQPWLALLQALVGRRQAGAEILLLVADQVGNRPWHRSWRWLQKYMGVRQLPAWHQVVTQLSAHASLRESHGVEEGDRYLMYMSARLGC